MSSETVGSSFSAVNQTSDLSLGVPLVLPPSSGESENWQWRGPHGNTVKRLTTTADEEVPQNTKHPHSLHQRNHRVRWWSQMSFQTFIGGDWENGRGRGDHGGVALLTNEPDLAGLLKGRGRWYLECLPVALTASSAPPWWQVCLQWKSPLTAGRNSSARPEWLSAPSGWRTGRYFTPLIETSPSSQQLTLWEQDLCPSTANLPAKQMETTPPKKERKKSWMKECDSDGRPREKKRIFILSCGEMGVIFFGNILCTPQQQGTADLHFQFTSDLHLLTRVFCSCSSVFSELTCMEKFAKLFKTLSNW